MFHLKATKPTFLVAVSCLAFVVAAPKLALAQPTTEITSENAKPREISSEADLAELIAQLNQPLTRLDALPTLIRFTIPKLYRVGSIYHFNSDAKFDALQNQAVEAILKHTDFETVSQALDSTDFTLQFWGVWFWRAGNFKARESQPNVWLSLIPKIKDVAIKGDASVRLQAIEALQRHAEAKIFLAERLEVETDPSIVMRLLNSSDKAEFSKQFIPYLLRFLNHQDREVRRQALLFIGFNHYSAPVWQVAFNKSVADKVLEMSKAADETERKAAVYALEGMKKKPIQD